MTYAKQIADALRPLAPGGKLFAAEIPLIDRIAEAWGKRAPDCKPFDLTNPVTCKVALEILNHEAIVPEAYKDSEGVWTWAAGVTDASGHHVMRYKDNPQTIERCLEVSVWLMRTKYGPDVLKAFARPLTEPQFAAALSFHYNTGAIGRAEWVKSWNAGLYADAHEKFMAWRKPASIIERREKERDLFFDGAWSQDGRTTIYQVSKPSYSPKWSSAKRVDVSAILAKLLGEPA